jgi:hypothetical protein
MNGTTNNTDTWGNGYIIVNQNGTYSYSVVKGELSATGSVTVDADEVVEVQLTGIEDHLSQKIVKIYPIPANDVLKVESLTEAKYQIYDISGKMILSNEITQGINNINTTGLTTGIYLLKITNDSGVYTEKINIKK